MHVFFFSYDLHKKMPDDSSDSVGGKSKNNAFNRIFCRYTRLEENVGYSSARNKPLIQLPERFCSVFYQTIPNSIFFVTLGVIEILLYRFQTIIIYHLEMAVVLIKITI